MHTQTQERDRKANKREREWKKRRIPPEELRKRLNPRYVFTDPNAFFHDLLMEQQETQ